MPNFRRVLKLENESLKPLSKKQKRNVAMSQKKIIEQASLQKDISNMTLLVLNHKSKTMSEYLSDVSEALSPHEKQLI